MKRREAILLAILCTSAAVHGQSRCLEIEATAPACSSNRTVNISGLVRTCANSVTGLTYTVNGSAPITVCTACGTNPTFNFQVTLPAAIGCADHVIALQAHDNAGATTSASLTIRVDTTPPTLRCPANEVVMCAGPDGVPLEVPLGAADDCPGPVTIVCDPPLGTGVFPGVTRVSCYAEDACGNRSAPCNFTVRVLSPATVNVAPTSVVAGTPMLVSGTVSAGSSGARILWSDGSNSFTIAQAPVNGAGAFSLNVNVPATAQPGLHRVQAVAIGSPGCDLASTVVTVIPTPPSSVRGTVVDRSSGRDQPIAGATVRLVKPDGLPTGTTETDGNGTYSFNDIGPGTYAVVVIKDGWFFPESSVSVSPGGQAGETLVAVPEASWPAPAYVSFVGGVAIPLPLSIYNGSYPVLVSDQSSAKNTGIISLLPALPPSVPGLSVRYWADVQFPGNPPPGERRVRFEFLNEAGGVIYAVNKTATQPVVANEPALNFNAYTSTAGLLDLNAHALPPGEVVLRVTPYIGNQAGYGKLYRIQVFDLGSRWIRPWVEIKPDPQTGGPLRVLAGGGLTYILNAELPQPDLAFDANIPLGIHTFENSFKAKVPFQEVFIARPGEGLHQSYVIPAELQLEVKVMDQSIVNEKRKYQPKGTGGQLRYEIGANSPLSIANKKLGPFTIYENGPGIHCVSLCIFGCDVCAGYKIWVDVTFAADVSLSTLINPDLSLDLNVFTSASGTLGGHFKAKAGVDIPGLGDVGCSANANVTGTVSVHLPFRYHSAPTASAGFDTPCVSLQGSAGADIGCVGINIGAGGNIGPFFWPENCLSAAATYNPTAKGLLPPAMAANPHVAADGAGGAMAVWIQNEIAAPGDRKPFLYYSHFNGESWSVPARLTPAAAPVGSPQVAFLAPDEAIAIWAQNKLSLAQIAEEGKVQLANQEIYFARWNGTVWSQPEPITSDENLDASPVLAANPIGGPAMALWIRRLDPPPAEPGKNIITVVSSIFDAGEWSPPLPLEDPFPAVNTLASLAFDATGVPWAVWQQHADGDLATYADRRLLIATQSRGGWTAPEIIPNVPPGAFAPSLAMDAMNQPLVIFTVPSLVADGSVGPGVGNRSTLWFAFKRGGAWEVGPVGMNTFAEDPIVRITPDNQATVLFRRFSEDPSRLSGDLGTAVANLDGEPLIWSLDYLTEDGQSNWQIAFDVDPGTSRHFALNVKQSPLGDAPDSMPGMPEDVRGAPALLRPGVNAPALFALQFAYEPDMTVHPENIHFSNAYPAPGENIMIHARVRNIGFKPTDANFAVKFYEVAPGNMEIGRVVISNAVPLGGVVPVSVPYLFRVGGAKTIRVVLDEENALAESDESNNSADAMLGVLRFPPNPVVFADAGAGAFVLNWDPPPTNGPVLYSIYRASSPGGAFELVGTSSGTTFTDPLIQPGTEYFYAVGGMDQFNVSSPSSDPVRALIEPGLKIRRVGTELILSWPSPSTAFELQETEFIGGGREAWTSVTEIPSASGDEVQVRLPAVQNGRFFRLRKP